MIFFPTSRLTPVYILAVIEPNVAEGEHSFNLLLDVVRSWRGPGYRFVVEEHVHFEGSITRDLVKGIDQLWFFGTELCDNSNGKKTVVLLPDEIAAIKERMDVGVGVFATGDHENIGSGLCEQVPRAGKMRVWSGADAPEQLPPNNYQSSIRSPYSDVVDPEAKICEPPPDERDGLPKPIWVFHYKNGKPHELMQLPIRGIDNGRIRFLPDHMHEGKVLDYEDKDFQGNLPPPDDFAPNSKPLIVARSIRTDFGPMDSPVGAKLYPVVSAYDPPQGSILGRVVVDSTFHHWTDSNALRLRFSPAWLHVEQYAINIANWLMGDTGRRKVAGSVKAYFSAIEISCMSTSNCFKDDEVESASDLAKSVSRFLGEHRLVADWLERILNGGLIQESEKVQKLRGEFPTLSEIEINEMRASGALQNIVLGVQFRELKKRRGQ